MRPLLGDVAGAGQALRVWRLDPVGVQTLSAFPASFDTHVTVTQDSHLAGTGLLSHAPWGQSQHPVHAWAGPGSMTLVSDPWGQSSFALLSPVPGAGGAVSLSQQRLAEAAQVQGPVRSPKANRKGTDL